MVERRVDGGPTFVQGLLQCTEHEVGLHGAADAPAHNAQGKHIDDGDHVWPALPDRNVGEVRDPQLIGVLDLERSVDSVQRGMELQCLAWSREYACLGARPTVPGASSAARPCSARSLRTARVRLGSASIRPMTALSWSNSRPLARPSTSSSRESTLGKLTQPSSAADLAARCSRTTIPRHG